MNQNAIFSQFFSISAFTISRFPHCNRLLVSNQAMHWIEFTTFENSLVATEQSFRDSGNVGQAHNEVMCAIEGENPNLANTLPKSYLIHGNRTLALEPELRTIRSNDLTVVSSINPDSKVPPPDEILLDFGNSHTSVLTV